PGLPVHFGFHTALGGKLFHGQVARCVVAPGDELHVTVVPWLWPLSRVVDSRVYVNQSIPEIVKSLFDDHGKKDYRLDIQMAAYPKLERCVRFQENVVQFVARLLERAGIYTYWEHAEGKHTLVVADGSVPPAACAAEPVPVRSA